MVEHPPLIVQKIIEVTSSKKIYLGKTSAAEALAYF
jgi:hypothetical protein